MSVTQVTTEVAEPGMTHPLRVAIVGTGFIGRVHARAARAAGATIVGAVGSSADRAAGAAEDVGAQRGFGSVAELIASARPDVVHVCTPNAAHVEGALTALDGGSHVVCEKPLATSLRDAARLADAAHRSGLVATVPFVYRFHPMVRQMRHLVATGDVGAVGTVHGSYLQDWLSGESDTSWRIDAATGGATRAFGDIGSHWCDLAEFVTGDRVARVAARTSEVVAREPVESPTTEDVAVLSFELESGVLGSVVVSQVSAGRKNRLLLEVGGTGASLCFDQEQPEQLWVGRRAGSQLLLRDPEHLSDDASRLSVLPAGHAQGYQDCFNAFVADTYAAVRGDVADGLPTFDDGRRAAEIADAVLRSAAEQGVWTEVPS